MMELDDLERKIRLLPDCPTRDLFQSKSRTLASKLWENIHATPERLVQLLCIRKGKVSTIVRFSKMYLHKWDKFLEYILTFCEIPDFSFEEILKLIYPFAEFTGSSFELAGSKWVRKSCHDNSAKHDTSVQERHPWPSPGTFLANHRPSYRLGCASAALRICISSYCTRRGTSEGKPGVCSVQQGMNMNLLVEVTK